MEGMSRNILQKLCLLCCHFSTSYIHRPVHRMYVVLNYKQLLSHYKVHAFHKVKDM